MFEVEFASSILGQHLIILFSWKGRFSEYQEMEDDADTEQVTNAAILTLGIFQVNYFRSHISWSPASDEHEVFVSTLSQAKVSNYTVIVSLFSQ